MEFKMIKDLSQKDRLAWYTDDVMQIAQAIDDVMTQIDHDESKEVITRNLRIVMLALYGLASTLDEDSDESEPDTIEQLSEKGA